MYTFYFGMYVHFCVLGMNVHTPVHRPLQSHVHEHMLTHACASTEQTHTTYMCLHIHMRMCLSHMCTHTHVFCAHKSTQPNMEISQEKRVHVTVCCVLETQAGGTHCPEASACPGVPEPACALVSISGACVLGKPVGWGRQSPICGGRRPAYWAM